MSDKILFIGGPWDRQRKPHPDHIGNNSDGVPSFILSARPKMSRRAQFKRDRRMMSDGFVTSDLLHRKRYVYTHRQVIAGNTVIRFWALKDITTDEALKRIFGDVSVHSGPVYNQPTPIK